MNQLEMKKMMSFLEENEQRAAAAYVPQMKQELASGYTSNATTDQEQGYFYPMMMISGNPVTLNPVDQPCNEEIIWEGLWNLDLDDDNGNFGASCVTTNKACFHSLVTTAPFC